MRLNLFAAGLVCFHVALGTASALNHPPFLVSPPEVSPTNGLANDRITFTAAAQDVDGDLLSYRWDFSDGWSATGRVTERRFGGGHLTISATVTVSDTLGAFVSGVVTTAPNNSPALWFGKLDYPRTQPGWTLSTKKALFMVLAFPDFTPIVPSNHLLQVAGEVSNFLSVCSHQLCDVAATVAPVLNMTLLATNYAGPNVQNLMREARTGARLAGLTPEAFDIEVFVVPSGKGLPGTSASIANRTCFINENGTNVPPGELAHEFGHCLGLQHANAWNTRDRSVIGLGQGIDYGNPFDIMGGVLSFPTNQMSCFAKHRLGWIEDDNAPEATNSRSIRLFAHDAVAWNPTNVVAVRAHAAWRHYWFEHRRRFTNNPWMNRGALVIAEPWPSTDQESVLLDVTPGSGFSFSGGPSQASDTLDSVLLIGRTFADPDGQLFVTALDATGTTNAVDLRIEIGAFPTNLPPTVNVTPSATNISVGVPALFSATASDPNGDELAYYWTFGDFQWWSTNGPSISKAWTNPGEYVARCEVSDMRGGLTSHQVLIRVGSPATLQLRGSVTSSNQPLEGVRVSASSNLIAWTDATGAYVIPNVIAGSYTVTAARGDTLLTRSFTNPIAVAGSLTGLNFSVLFNNTAPVVLPPGNQVLPEDGLIENLPFTVNDTQSAARDVLLTMASDNPSLIDSHDCRFQIASTNPTIRRLSLRPRPGASGVANITLTASDGLATTSTTFSLTVVAENDAPLSRGADRSTDGVIALPGVSGVLAGVTDDESDPITATLVAPPLNGTALLQPDGSCIYVANPGFNGQDSLVFIATAGTTGNRAALVFNVTSSTTTLYDTWALQQFQEQFTNTGVTPRDADPDGDAVDNWDEFLADTSPTNGSSTLAITSVSATPSVQFASSAARVYDLEGSDDLTLTPEAWQSVSTNITGNGENLSVTDPAPVSHRIYRIKARHPLLP